MDDYDEQAELVDYVWRSLHQHITVAEWTAWKALAGEGKAERSSPDLAYAIRSRFPAPWLAEGPAAFRRRVAERVLREHDPPVNRCPACERVVRTPKAQQCLWCGHDWHGQGQS